jgi:hypothetical protein
MRAALTAMALIAATRVARADDVPGFDDAIHWQLEPSVRVGSIRLDGTSVGNFGLALDAGVRIGRAMLVVQASEHFVSSDQGVAVTSAMGGAASAAGSDGTMDRIGAQLRVYFARAVDQEMLVGDGWLGVGVGRETFSWSAGGVLARNDVDLAVGGTLGFHGDHWKADQHRWWGGMTYALHVVLARRVDGLQPIACGGPCDMATRPPALDRTILFDTVFPFGQ